jgi:hypothetical protein
VLDTSLLFTVMSPSRSCKSLMMPTNFSVQMQVSLNHQTSLVTRDLSLDVITCCFLPIECIGKVADFTVVAHVVWRKFSAWPTDSVALFSAWHLSVMQVQFGDIANEFQRQILCCWYYSGLVCWSNCSN